MKRISAFAMVLAISCSGLSHAGLREVFQPTIVDGSIVDDGGYSACAGAGCASNCGHGCYACVPTCCAGLWDGYCAEKRQCCPSLLPAIRLPQFGCNCGCAASCTPCTTCDSGCCQAAPCGSCCGAPCFRLPPIVLPSFAGLHHAWHRLRGCAPICDTCGGCDAGCGCAGNFGAVESYPTTVPQDVQSMELPTSADEAIVDDQDEKSARRRPALFNGLFPSLN